VRKHLSAIKGGQLASFAKQAKLWSLILSDVVGDDLDVIGSGPTTPDRSTFAMALAVLDRYGVRNKAPREVRNRLAGGGAETPKPGDPVFDRVHNQIIGSNQKCLEAAARRARELGFRAVILSSTIEGETRDVARMHAAMLRQIRHFGQPVRPPACVISGGETTVTLRGQGIGGRNQEFALAAAIDISGLENVVMLSAGTDGTDGPTTAAGAIADGATLSRSALDAPASLARNDSNTYFAALDDLLITGPTGTNVMDIHIGVVG
jgi:hydroxypyruvate reductase